MRHKGPRDLVTSGDLAAQEAVMSTISAAFPGHDIVSEEGNRAGDGSDGQGFSWVVDPVDGTTNYYRGLPFFSVSVALVQGKQLLVGAVYDPSRDELFTAIRGLGAWLDEQPIRVADTATLEETVFGLGSPYGAQAMRRNLDLSLDIVPRCATLRTIGSAALSLCYIASGRMDVYMHPLLSPWDTAAGALVLKEAGGTMTDWQGRDWQFGGPEVLASSPKVHAEVLALLHAALEG